MALPKQIKIGGLSYNVLKKTDIKEGEKDYWGTCNYGERTITLETTWPNNNQEFNTILHECIHAILEERGIKQTEHLVDQMSLGLTQLLRDNPKLTKHLMELL